jgi:hypothetical protein
MWIRPSDTLAGWFGPGLFITHFWPAIRLFASLEAKDVRYAAQLGIGGTADVKASSLFLISPSSIGAHSPFRCPYEVEHCPRRAAGKTLRCGYRCRADIYAFTKQGVVKLLKLQPFCRREPRAP